METLAEKIVEAVMDAIALEETPLEWEDDATYEALWQRCLLAVETILATPRQGR